MHVWHLIYALYSPALNVSLNIISAWLYDRLKRPKTFTESDRFEVHYYESGAVAKVITEKIVRR